MSLRKLKDIAPREELNLLTVLARQVHLERRNGKSYLVAHITDDDKVLTSSRERRQHFNDVDTERFQQQLKIWKNGEEDRVIIANLDHPLEFIAGGICPILVLDDGEFVVSVRRDIFPKGFLIFGGCPVSIEELLNPRLTAVREAIEELLLGDTGGRVFSIGDPTVLKQGLQDWGVEVKEILPAKIEEVYSARGVAQHLELHMLINGHVETRNIPDVNLFLDADVASLQLVLEWRISFPAGIKVADLRVWDGERLPDGHLIRRLVRLSTPQGLTRAFYMNGDYVPIQGGWLSENMAEQGTPG